MQRSSLGPEGGIPEGRDECEVERGYPCLAESDTLLRRNGGHARVSALRIPIQRAGGWRAPCCQVPTSFSGQSNPKYQAAGKKVKLQIVRTVKHCGGRGEQWV